ncbi:unnamed protein product [Amoebophrya sp. A25]|nr:unnamed protein product [Amoebophrya sp. A25]|eukprot:GSA25T00011917001.1
MIDSLRRLLLPFLATIVGKKVAIFQGIGYGGACIAKNCIGCTAFATDSQHMQCPWLQMLLRCMSTVSLTYLLSRLVAVFVLRPAPFSLYG